MNLKDLSVSEIIKRVKDGRIKSRSFKTNEAYIDWTKCGCDWDSVCDDCMEILNDT